MSCTRARGAGARGPVRLNNRWWAARSFEARVVGSQQNTVTEQRSETACPARRPESAPQRTQRKHRPERHGSCATERHDRRQGRRLTPDDRSHAAHDEDGICRTRPMIVRLPEDVVEHVLELVATTLDILEPNQRSWPSGNDHGHPEVDIGLSLVHEHESMRIDSGQLVGAKALLRPDVGPMPSHRSSLMPIDRIPRGWPDTHRHRRCSGRPAGVCPERGVGHPGLLPT